TLPSAACGSPCSSPTPIGPTLECRKKRSPSQQQARKSSCLLGTGPGDCPQLSGRTKASQFAGYSSGHEMGWAYDSSRGFFAIGERPLELLERSAGTCCTHTT